MTNLREMSALELRQKLQAELDAVIAAIPKLEEVARSDIDNDDYIAALDGAYQRRAELNNFFTNVRANGEVKKKKEVKNGKKKK